MANPHFRPVKPLIYAMLAALLIFVLTAATDWAAMRDPHYMTVGHFSDNTAAALIVAILVFLFERRRSRELAEKLNTIALMNHHIRNALQVIVNSSPPAEEATRRIRDAVARIDWALREVLPRGANAPMQMEYPPSQEENQLSRRGPPA